MTEFAKGFASGIEHNALQVKMQKEQIAELYAQIKELSDQRLAWFKEGWERGVEMDRKYRTEHVNELA